MRILIEPSDYPELQNLGDVAMQTTAIRRVAKLWPSANIQVFTDSPETLPNYASNVQEMSTVGRRAWMSGLVPERRVLRFLSCWERGMRAKHVQIAERIATASLTLYRPHAAAALRSFLETTRTTDLLVVCGMGGITDVFEKYALDLLETMELVKNNGTAVVAMFGQAFGPIGDHTAVFQKASEVLPRVDLIALREARTSIPLLQSIGVNPSRVIVTGDDALEIAAENRQSKIKDCIGINQWSASTKSR